MSGMDESRAKAIFDFFGCFMTVSIEINELADLSDGIAMFEALSEMLVVPCFSSSSLCSLS
jgi:hypothetical protein